MNNVQDIATVTVLEPYVTLDQLCEHLQMKPRWVRYQVAENGLPVKRLGRSLRFRLSEVEAWLERQQG